MSSRLERTQGEVNEVTAIMKDNVNKVLERDGKLNDLDDRAENLQVGANQFERTSTNLKRRMYWKNVKMWVIIAIVVIVIAAILGVIIWQATK
ncbi:vesicle-associated membrane protein 3-like [Sycon ciliatum]|uniref:vesicle-associated membrane protein 3-like n=1 Tax=Sycon ciliatum TaxID=27933 RepID=UPI0020A88C94